MKKEYLITEFFNKFKEITINGVAEKAKMNESLLRQYTSGIKVPSLKQLKRIEKAVHDIGKELSVIQVAR